MENSSVKVPGTFRWKNIENAYWLTSGEWRCFLASDSKLALGQPISFKKIKSIKKDVDNINPFDVNSNWIFVTVFILGSQYVPTFFCKEFYFCKYVGASLFFNKVAGLGQGNEKPKQDKNIRKGKKTKWMNFFSRGLFRGMGFSSW